MMNEATDGITRESFSKLSHGSKLDILFDLTCNVHKRLETLEKRKIYDKLLALLVGLFAGGAAWIIK